MIDIEKLAFMIKSHRGDKGLRALASELGSISSSTLSRVEQGNLPDIDTYVTLCKWLGVSTDYFIIKDEPEPDKNTVENIEFQLRADKTLPPKTTDALMTMIKLAYEQASNEKNKSQV